MWANLLANEIYTLYHFGKIDELTARQSLARLADGDVQVIEDLPPLFPIQLWGNC